MNKRLHELMMEATKDMPHCYFWPGEYVEKWNRGANNETTIP